MDNFEDIFGDTPIDEPIDGTPIVPTEPVEPIESGDSDPFFDDIDEPGGDTTLSVWDEYLAARGFNEGKLKIIDENEEEVEVSFYDLTREEQMDILRTGSEESNDDIGLDDSEVELINQIRGANQSVAEFLEEYKKGILEEIEVPEDSYDIDSYDDQELFLLDLKNKWDLTDEELTAELERELQNEPLFKKKVDVLRKEYKELEDQYKQGQLQEQQEREQEQYTKFSEKMVGIANAVSDFHGIEPEDDEKNEVLSTLLDRDEAGVTSFYKTLNDPEKLYEMAWYARYGKEAFDTLRNAYESEIQKLKKPDKPTVIHKTPKTGGKERTSIHDLI